MQTACWSTARRAWPLPAQVPIPVEVHLVPLVAEGVLLLQPPPNGETHSLHAHLLVPIVLVQDSGHVLLKEWASLLGEVLPTVCQALPHSLKPLVLLPRAVLHIHSDEEQQQPIPQLAVLDAALEVVPCVVRHVQHFVYIHAHVSLHPMHGSNTIWALVQAASEQWPLVGIPPPLARDEGGQAWQRSAEGNLLVDMLQPSQRALPEPGLGTPTCCLALAKPLPQPSSLPGHYALHSCVPGRPRLRTTVALSWHIGLE
eukprot:109880-Alexandrium_andersonii.AAC.1